MKKNKLLSILLLPILAVSVLVGCSGSKTMYSAFDSFVSTKNKYSTLGNKINTTSISKYDNSVYVSATSDLFYVLKQSDDEYVLTSLFDAKYDISILNESNISKLRSKATLEDGSNNDINLSSRTYNGYYAIYKIQDSIAKGVFNYYNKYVGSFYNAIDKVKVSSSDIKEYNKRMDAWVTATGKFAAAKEVFVSRVKISGELSIHSFIFSEFSKSYNDYIESSIKLVDYFKDLQIKYLLQDKAYTDQDSAERIVDEMVFNIAKTLYYEDLKSFNYSDCDLGELANDIVSHTNANDLTNSYAKVLFTYLSKTTSSITSSNGDRVFVCGSYASSRIFGTRKYAFISAINSFNKKFALYQSIYNDIDVYAYNRARSGYGSVSVEDFINAQTAEMQAKYNFMQDFHNYTLTEYARLVLNDPEIVQ